MRWSPSSCSSQPPSHLLISSGNQSPKSVWPQQLVKVKICKRRGHQRSLARGTPVPSSYQLNRHRTRTGHTMRANGTNIYWSNCCQTKWREDKNNNCWMFHRRAFVMFHLFLFKIDACGSVIRSGNVISRPVHLCISSKSSNTTEQINRTRQGHIYHNIKEGRKMEIFKSAKSKSEWSMPWNFEFCPDEWDLTWNMCWRILGMLPCPSLHPDRI